MKEDMTKFKFRKNHKNLNDDDSLSLEKVPRKKQKVKPSTGRGRGRPRKPRRTIRRRRISSLDEDSLPIQEGSIKEENQPMESSSSESEDNEEILSVESLSSLPDENVDLGIQSEFEDE
jgi:hypothetical protein